MSQSKTKLLKRLFTRIQPFPSGDARNSRALKRFLNDYEAIPANHRAGFLREVESQIAQAEAKALAEATT